jgi:L-alanine-DL-glutamate epimerase-like enolase superfamily enzyme
VVCYQYVDSYWRILNRRLEFQNFFVNNFLAVMNTTRRDFLKISGLTLGLSLVDKQLLANKLVHQSIKKSSGKMKLSFQPYDLMLKYMFTVASNSRISTPVVLTQIEYEGLIGYGEASMPPYLGESHETVLNFLNKVDLSNFTDPFRLDEILTYVDSIDEKNTAAKASIDIALHDLIGKILHQPLYKLLGLSKENTPNTSFTIGIDTADIIREKTLEAGNRFKVLKVKLGKNNDKEIIKTIRSVTNIPLSVDVNQGWKDKYYALEMIQWLKEKKCNFRGTTHA